MGGGESLRNLGPKSRDWLAAVGISTHEALSRVGSVRAYLAVEAIGVAPTLNLLWGLEGAIRDMDWRDLTLEDKSRLRAALAAERGT